MYTVAQGMAAWVVLSDTFPERVLCGISVEEKTSVLTVINKKAIKNRLYVDLICIWL
jgi:hypothetical protein